MVGKGQGDNLIMNCGSQDNIWTEKEKTWNNE